MRNVQIDLQTLADEAYGLAASESNPERRAYFSGVEDLARILIDPTQDVPAGLAWILREVRLTRRIRASQPR